MPEINDALILKLADLARLELSTSELQAYSKSLTEILGHVHELEALKTEGVVPMIHGTDDSLRMRADEACTAEVDCNGQPKILNSAPETEGGGIKVPPVL